MDVTTPEILQHQSANIQLLAWVFGLVVTGLLLGLRTIWKENRELTTYIRSQTDYIREQDKSNLLLLTELLNISKSSGVDVSKLSDLIYNSLSPNLQDMLIIIKSLEKQILNKL
jgi:hypothetical protein